MAFYDYDPSQAASVVSASLFGVTTALHIYQLLRRRTWYFIPFLIGGLFQVFGYIVRCLSISQKPDYEKNPFIIQQILILLAPALYAASIYMILGRMILLVHAESYSLIRRSWLTKIFVSGDIVSMVVQGAGGGFMAAADTLDKQQAGSNIIVGGLFIQLAIFGLFITSVRLAVPWRRYILVLYGVSALIMARSIFRVVEFIDGKGGELMSNEIYVYVLDALLMFFVSVILNIFHPSSVISAKASYETQLGPLGTSDSASGMVYGA
uniref:RTA1 like protein n=1 Tax=Bionectria ochroleuca TaxID=29856 RepID=A0A8H7K4S7_BIOOC